MNLKNRFYYLLISWCFLFIAGISSAAVPGPEYTDQTMECQFIPELTALAADLDMTL